jgi:hypothetical protein
MDPIDSLVATVSALGRQIEEHSAEIRALRDKVLTSREVWTIADIAREIPEAPCLKTLRNNLHRQPNHGIPDGYIGSQKAWYRETVLAWRRELRPSPKPRGWNRRQLGGVA